MKDLFGHGSTGETPWSALSAKSAAQGLFQRKIGSPAFEALLVLMEGWKLSFDHLERDPTVVWNARYSALWHLVGTRGTVPSGPVEYPEGGDQSEGENQFYPYQWRTVFDLLRKPAELPDEAYEDQPVFGMFLRNFAKIKPPGRSLVEMANPLNDKLPGKTDPCSFPWVSLGILGKKLSKHQMHPVVLAVDLSKTTESILRDLKHIIDAKRKETGLCVTDRRVSEGSFKQIERLDTEVIGDGRDAPASRVVKDFERAAQLDLGHVLDVLEASLTRATQVDPDDDELFGTMKREILKPLDFNKVR